MNPYSHESFKSRSDSHTRTLYTHTRCHSTRASNHHRSPHGAVTWANNEFLSYIRKGMDPTSPLGTTKATTIFVLLLFVTVVADSAEVENGSETGAQRQRRTPREFMVVTPEKMNAVANSTIFLPCYYTCTISGVNHTLAEWLRRDGREEERIYLFPNGNSSRGPLKASWMGDFSKCDASITVSDIQTHDSGRYRCEVTVFPQNKHDIGYLQLNVTSPSELVVVTPDKMDAMAGSTFLLPCSYTCTISGVTTKLVEWLRFIDGREERIYLFPNGNSSRGPLKASWMGDLSKCDASITVSNIQTHDSGQYRCEVSVYSPTLQFHIGYLQLTVLPRTDLAVVTPVEVKARVDSTVLLPCSYTCTIGDVTSTLVEWFRTIDGQNEKVYKIIHRKRSLRPLQVTWVGDESTCDASITISDIQTHDAGRYRCEVTIYRHDKPSMKDIGYLQLNVHNEPEPTDATPMPITNPTSAPAQSPVAGIVPGVIAAILVVAAVVGFYCWKKRQSRLREAEATPQEMQKLNQNGEDGGARSGQDAPAEQGDEPNDEEGECQVAPAEQGDEANDEKGENETST
ncbi:uncharacterized protein LOC133339381 [Lethenteron reissneri]|uniref:uncharacterized protein LOC133339381 n=1 Tax=Lethenteron reissneri TaxID=7753 RepID=UPI002AB6FE37|nr:uncharacterized protein LOC133339381 [Lethenteron reissneri]